MTNRKAITGFLTSYRCSAYVNAKSPQRMPQKVIYCYLNKIQFQSNKVCYRVSLCENFQRHSYSITIPLSNCAQMLARNVSLTLQPKI